MSDFCRFSWALVLRVTQLLFLQSAVQVNVTTSEAASVRLVDGTDPCSGRVEVLHSGLWRPVCYNDWDVLDAHVVCRELGCGEVKEVNMEIIEKNIVGWLSKIQCTGQEATLIDCENENWGSYLCNEKFATVTCRSKTRLVDGISRCSGRVEVFHNETWGSVADSGWDLSDAAVVCREVGCGDVVESKGDSYFGEGPDQMWLFNVNCFGNESTLHTCKASNFSETSSFPEASSGEEHLGNAGVICESVVRLVSGINPCSGRVEVLHNGTWGTVCEKNWGLLDGEVVCAELGCGDLSVTYRDFGQSPKIWMDNVNCLGLEPMLGACFFDGWGEYLCGSTENAGVVCGYPVRLANGLNSCSGRVEVFYNGEWGTVCDSGWDLSDAAVVCRELGCGDAVEAKSDAYFGRGTGPSWMRGVECVGSEASLLACNSAGWRSNSCGHPQDAGVVCKSSANLQHGGHSVLLRIEVKTEHELNPNSATLTKELLNHIHQKMKTNETFSLRWKTQRDGNIFQKTAQKKRVIKTCD